MSGSVNCVDCKPARILATFEHAECNARQFVDRVKPRVSRTEVITNDKRETVFTITTSSAEFTSASPTIKSPAPKEKVRRRYFLTVRDRKSDAVSLVPVEFVTFRAANVKHPASTNPLVVATDNGSVDERANLKHAASVFNDLKRRRLDQRATFSDLDVRVVEHQMQQATGGELNSDHSQEMGESQPILMTPPCNRNAVDVSGVYKLVDILSPSDMEMLLNKVPALIGEYNTVDAIETAVKNKRLTLIMANMLRGTFGQGPSVLTADDIMNSFDDSLSTCTQVNHIKSPKAKRLVSIAVGIFVEGLVQMAQSRKPAATNFLPHLPYKLQSRIVDNFCHLGRWTPELKDKCLCFIIVMLLLVTNYCIDLAPLLEAFRMKINQLKKLASVVGAVVKTDALTGRSFIILRLPLATFDMARNARSKKGRQS